MKTDDKNIIYTYVPPEIDWIHNKDFYLTDLYCLAVSVQLFKSKFKYKSIILYTTPELISFFKDTHYFDKLFDISNCYDVIKEQNAGFSHKNIMFKVFVAAQQTEPFIHIDHDFFINNKNIFDKVNRNIIFSFIETASNPYGNQLNNPYSFYIKVFSDICRVVDDVVLDNFNPLAAYNSSIFGCNGNELIKSFTKTKDFLLRNYKKLNNIKDLPIVLEQFVQINYLLEETKFDDYFVFGDLVKTGNTSDDIVNTELYNNPSYSNLNKDVYGKLLNHFNSSDIIHLSGYRWHSYYKVILVSILKNLDMSMHELIKSTYGSYNWNTHTF
jgi:hypothetical protein